MQPSPSRRPPQAADTLMSSHPPMSPLSSGEPSPFDLLGEDGDAGPASPSDDLDGSQHDSSGQKWDSTTEIAEQARHEAEIENRIAELRKEGSWTPRRLSKFPEPTRPKVQWDYLCEEMQWLSGDFAQERRWKRGVARKVVRMVVRHHEELKQKEERARREEQAKLRRIATSIAKEVRQFWSNVEKVVQFKQQSRLEAKRKKALDLQLDFIVGQTEKYSDLLSQSLNEAAPASKTSSSGLGSSQGGSLRTSPTPSLFQKDGEFLPDKGDEEEDDEETIEIEERQDGNDAESHRLELELLRRESELPLDELLQGLPEDLLQEDLDVEDADSNLHDDDDDSSSSEEDQIEEDDEFTANEDEAEDEEETIEAEEALESQRDHTQELSELAKEGEMSIEDLLRKYSLVRTDDEETVDQSDSSRVTDGEGSGSLDCEYSDSESEGVEFLVKPEDEETGTDQSQLEAPEPKKEITDIAATAESLQPKGYTLATTQVKTQVPFLLRGDLREYQHIGLEWLVTMYEKKLNGILADEMGLGKTIQTIALLAHLACERGNWGPHLIIVPTSVILNWEMELKRWCPSFKILTYYGSQKERKLKRQGWTKANAFHVCITSYKLVLQDHQAFRRKNWRYLILDEAQNIKNFKSQRWQSLLNFNSQRRLLLTGTPLQNSLMELWSLMHFLMPHVFQSHREFKEWFSNPLTGMIEGSQEYNEGLVRRLHKVLRPFLLRRIKLDVEKQMPKKYEHVIYCRLSKRQRFLYDDFMSQASTRESLTSGHFMSVINILMQLRKVCNHPNLFDPRPIHSPFITSGICYSVPSLVLHALQQHPLEHVDTAFYNLVNLEGRTSRYESDIFLPRYKPSRLLIQEIADSPEPPPRPRTLKMKVNRMLQPVVKPDPRPVVMVNSSRPAPKPSDPATSPPPPPPVPPPPPPIPTSPPAQATPSPPVPPAPGPAPAAPCSLASPPLVLPSPVPASVTPVSSSPGKTVPVQNPMQTSQPVYSGQQRFILTPDMQARLPSGEVISLGQLASFSGRPLQNPSVTKPLTLQLQGAKLTLSGSQVRPVGVGQPRPVQGNVLHLVSSGGQHHLLSQPAQLALIQALAQQASSPASTAAAQLLPNTSPAQIGVQTLSVQGIQHPLVNNSNLPAAAGPNMTSPGQVMPAQGVVKIVVRQAPRDVQPSPQRPPLPAQVRPMLRVLPGPHAEQTGLREASVERAAPVMASSGIPLASSPLLMVSSPAAATRLPSPNAVATNEDSLTPPLSAVALRLVTSGTSSVQLTNHQSSPPRHTASPALPNCFPCPSPIPVNNPDPVPSPLPQKDAPNTDWPLPSHHPVHNGNGVQNQLADISPSTPPCTSGLSTLQSPSPPVANLSKVSPPTYNLSLVPTLIANNSSNTARFLTSPVSLLALSALSSTNSGSNPVLYTPPSATGFPALAAASLSAPLPAASVSTSLPILATPVSGQLAPFGAPLPVSSANQNPLTVPYPPSMDAHSAPTSLPVLPTPASTSLLTAQGAASLLEASSSQPLLLAPDSMALPLLDTPASEALPPLMLNTSLKIPTMASTPVSLLPGAAVPLLAQPSSNAVPLLAAQSSNAVPLLAASSSNVVPLLAVSSSNAVPLLAASSSNAVPLLATSSSNVVPLLATPSSNAVPLLATPSSNAVPLLATPSSNAVPLLATPSSNAVPLLATPSSNAVPLLATPSSNAVPLLATPSSTAVPLLATPSSNAVPLLATSSSNAVPLLSPPSGKVPPSFISGTPPSNSLPLLSSPSTTLTPSTAVATTDCVPGQPALAPLSSARPITPVASMMLTTSPSVTYVASSSSPSLVVTPSPWLSKLPNPLCAVQPIARGFLPSSLLDAQAPVASIPAELPVPSCSLSADSSAPLLPSAALEASVLSTLVGSVSTAGSLPTLQLRPPASQSSISSSIVSPSMPPASCPSLPASTPVPVPPLPVSTPTPVPLLPASCPDQSPLLLVTGQASDSSSLAPSIETAPMSLLPPSASVTPPGISPSLMASVPSHTPVLPSSCPAVVTEAKAGPLPSPPASCSNLPSSTFSTSAPLETTPVNNPEPSQFPESSLSLSVAGPPPVNVALGTTPESDIKLEQEEPRFSFSAAVNTSIRPRRVLPPLPRSPFYLEPLEERRKKQKMERLDRIFHLNERRCSLSPVYGTEILSVCTLQQSLTGPEASTYLTDTLRSCVFGPEQRLAQLRPIIERFIIAMPPVEAPQITLHTSHPPPSMLLQEMMFREAISRELAPHTRCLHRIISNMRTQFPDLRLIQYDCGKLQTLDHLLRDLKYGGHRVLLFTQMTRMLDVLEQFLNYHGHIYLRLDGSTRVEQRQVLMERFNMDKRIFCFILSTRSGGVGVNLTGADTVIFYDSDWNPTMDAQAQDRCHRIGQTRDVHIYRLVSERTVEENILKKAQQKRMLGDMAIEGGNFTTAYFKQQTIRELFDMEDLSRKECETLAASPEQSTEEVPSSKQTHILEQALGRAEDEEDTLAASLVRAEQVADLDEFNENAPLEPEEEEQSRVEQEISALVEQLTPIERYAMYFLEASLEEISKEELKQAEEQVEAARKDLILAKDEGCPNYEDKWEEDMRKNRRVRTPVPSRPPGERLRVSERLKGNRAAESTDTTESTAAQDVSSTQEVLQEVPTEILEVPPVSVVKDSSPGTVNNLPEESEGVPEAMSPGTPAVAQAEECPVEVQEDELVVTVVAKQEEVAELSMGAAAEGHDGSEQPPPGSPIAPPAPQEELTPPRTPRRKVTADCEILLAGASETSPTAKVLRRLPGRLVTVVQERSPAARRQNKGKGQKPVSDDGTPIPDVTDHQSPPRDLLSEDGSEAGSPPPKRKRGRPPRNPIEVSPAAVSTLSPADPSPVSPLAVPVGTVISLLSGQTPTSPIPSSKLKLENENVSTEKRKRGRPPKRREASPALSPTSPAVSSAVDTLSPAAASSALLLSSVCTSTTSPGSTSVKATQSDTTAAKMAASQVKAGNKDGNPAMLSIIPTDSSNIPSLGGETTSSSTEEPVMPAKRKPGRPRRLQVVPKMNSSPKLHTDKLDSSPDRTPSPKPTRARQRKQVSPKVEPKVQTSSQTETENSSCSEEEEVKRTPLTRSARTRLEANSASPTASKNSEASPKPHHTHSPRTTPASEKPPTKKRKPPSGSSPSPPSSPNGSSSTKQKVPRKKGARPAVERILRSALTANPASNTRSSRNQVIYSPSSHRGRKAKT